MAIKDVNNHPSKQVGFHMETLTGKEQISNYIDNVTLILRTEYSPQVAKIVSEGGKVFLNKSIGALMGSSSERCKVELHDALKSRSDDLIKVITSLIEELGSEDEIDIALKEEENGSVIIYNTFTNEIIWSKKDFNPRFTKILLRTIIEVLRVTKQHDEVREALRCILSFSTVYKDLRGSHEYTIQQEKEALERLSSTKFTTNEEFMVKTRQQGTLENEFAQFMSRFLQKDNSDDQLFEEITRNFRNALKRFVKYKGKQFLKYDKMRDANFSFKSSGTTIRIKGKTHTIPAVIASGFEKDLLEEIPCIKSFDDLLGFEGEFGFLYSKLVKSKYRPTVSIPQKKLAIRIIHIGDNPRQDRLGYVHNAISAFLKMYNCDCTFNQNEGIKFCLRASGQTSYAVYCMDQSKATDTMLIAAQKMALTVLFAHIFKKDTQKVKAIVEAWAYMVSGEENTFYMSNQTTQKYRMIVGQPQGYLSSFASFALLNHFVMLFSLYKYCKHRGYMCPDARNLYRLVGDDSAVMLFDNDEEGKFRDIYIECNKMVNVDVNPTKGFSNFGSKRTSTTAEFAKVLSINGRYFTPTPFNIASSSANTTPENFLKYLLWLRDKCDFTFKQETIFKLLNERFTLSTEQLIGLEIVLNTKIANNDFYQLVDKENKTPVDEKFAYRLAWFNFMNMLSKSICKYTLKYSDNEKYLGVESQGLAKEAMFKEIKFFKYLEEEFDLSNIPKESKLYREYSLDFIKKEIFPVLKENSTEDLISIVEESEILTDYMLEALEQDLVQIGENLETIDAIITNGPDGMDDESMNVIKNVTPLLCHRSWSLKSYQIDCNYLSTIGKKLGQSYLSYSNELFGTNYDTSAEQEFNQPFDKTIEINYDLGLDFEF